MGSAYCLLEQPECRRQATLSATPLQPAVHQRAARRAPRPARSAGSCGGPSRDGGAGGGSGQGHHTTEEARPPASVQPAVLAKSARDAGAAIARDPDHLVVDAGVQIAAALVVREEGV